MKKLLVVILLLSGVAHSECYMRSSTRITRSQIWEQPTDFQRLVVPDTRGQKCVLRYRVNIRLDWQTVEGVGYGRTEAEACSQAMDLSKGYLLVEATPKTVRADSQMVCSDLPEIRVHPVRIGDVIWQSEVDVHPMPEERPYFWYKRTQCRLFAERDHKEQNLMIYQGVICKMDSDRNGKWRVLDKY
jgi:hypothetical protein